MARSRWRQAQLALASGAVFWNVGLGIVLWLRFRADPRATLAAVSAPILIALGEWAAVWARSKPAQAIATGLMLVVLLALFPVGILYGLALAMMIMALVLALAKNP